VALPIARPLRIGVDRVGAALAVRPGALLAAGDLIATAGARREVRASVASLFIGWDRTDGTALVAPLGAPSPIHSHVGGTIEKVAADRIEVAVEGVAIDGIGGTGDAVHGEIVVAVHEPADELRASAIDVESGGRIVVGGSRTSAETLIRARAMGVAGIVLGGLLDKEMRDFEAIQRRRREVGSVEGGFGLLLIEGYGKVAFDPGLFAWFGRQEGRTATLFGAERRLYVYGADSPPPPRRVPARPGDAVIAHRRPFAGRTGIFLRELDALHAAPSGIQARCGLVRFADGRVVAVPVANLEATERSATD
jgi:hypothetical protein